MKLLIFLIFTILSVHAIGQNTQLDTVFVKRSIDINKFEIDTLYIQGGVSTTQVLAGTTFLPSSDKIVGLLNKGLSPIDIRIINTCDDRVDSKEFSKYPKFRNIERQDNKLIIDVSVIANCCHNFLAEAEVLAKDTLNLLYTSYGDFCSCECPFTLRYTFDTTFEKNYQILKHVTINGSTKVENIPR